VIQLCTITLTIELNIRLAFERASRFVRRGLCDASEAHPLKSMTLPLLIRWSWTLDIFYCETVLVDGKFTNPSNSPSHILDAQLILHTAQSSNWCISLTATKPVSQTCNMGNSLPTSISKTSLYRMCRITLRKAEQSRAR